MGHHFAHQAREKRRHMVTMPMLAEPEIVAAVGNATTMGVGCLTRVDGHGVENLLGGDNGSLPRACCGLDDWSEHQGSRKQDACEAPYPSPKCPMSHHNRVYIPVTTYEQLITSRSETQASVAVATGRPSGTGLKARTG